MGQNSSQTELVEIFIGTIRERRTRRQKIGQKDARIHRVEKTKLSRLRLSFFGRQIQPTLITGMLNYKLLAYPKLMYLTGARGSRIQNAK